MVSSFSWKMKWFFGDKVCNLRGRLRLAREAMVFSDLKEYFDTGGQAREL